MIQIVSKMLKLCHVNLCSNVTNQNKAYVCMLKDRRKQKAKNVVYGFDCRNCEPKNNGESGIKAK